MRVPASKKRIETISFNPNSLLYQPDRTAYQLYRKNKRNNPPTAPSKPSISEKPCSGPPPPVVVVGAVELFAAMAGDAVPSRRNRTPDTMSNIFKLVFILLNNTSRQFKKLCRLHFPYSSS